MRRRRKGENKNDRKEEKEEGKCGINGQISTFYF
jgi:hypothetical protein